MSIDCPRCGTPNSRWDRCCRSCWLPLDAAIRAPQPLPDSASGAAPALDAAGAAASTADHAAYKSLADVLGVEVEHAAALADNGIHTLEHVAQSLPDRIAHALGAWTHLDPRALIARAQHLLQPAAPPSEPVQPRLKEDVDAADWWKMT